MQHKNISINFATSNKNKFKEFKQILEPQIKVVHIDIVYPEMRSDDTEEISIYSDFFIHSELSFCFFNHA